MFLYYIEKVLFADPAQKLLRKFYLIEIVQILEFFLKNFYLKINGLF